MSEGQGSQPPPRPVGLTATVRIGQRCGTNSNQRGGLVARGMPQDVRAAQWPRRQSERFVHERSEASIESGACRWFCVAPNIPQSLNRVLRLVVEPPVRVNVKCTNKDTRGSGGGRAEGDLPASRCRDHVRRHRPAEQVALRFIAAESDFRLAWPAPRFRHLRQPRICRNALSQVDDGRHDRHVLPRCPDIPAMKARSIFNASRGRLCNLTQTGVAGAEVIHEHLHPGLAQLQEFLHVRAAVFCASMDSVISNVDAGGEGVRGGPKCGEHGGHEVRLVEAAPRKH